MRFILNLSIGTLLFFSCSDPKTEFSDSKQLPNIIIIYADDLGYGDMGAYGSQITLTPVLDTLAQNGRIFTDGHAPSATCTPSRFGLLTGMYPWRNEKARILSGSAPLLIDTSRATLASMLRQQGYRTGIVGKWHLGLGDGNINWNETISPGPNELGFDYSHILAATQDRVPTVYIENGRVVNLDKSDPIEVSYSENFAGEPTGIDNPGLLTMQWDHGHNNSIVNGIGRIGFMRGGVAARWTDSTMADHFREKAVTFIDSTGDKPFFLYYALQQPHVPRTPHPRFQGKTGLGPRGDVILEMDDCIGQLVAHLDSIGKLENTLIIFSSDNGPVLNDGYVDQAVELNGSHTPWGPFRGGKYSLYEAGTRVPFIVYWKGTIPAGTSDVLISQLDLFSSLASLAGSPLRGPDSFDFMSTLLGTSETGRSELIVEAIGRTALRSESWKMIPPHEGKALLENVTIESGASVEYQLYNTAIDPGEQLNLADSLPQILSELVKNFEQLKN